LHPNREVTMRILRWHFGYLMAAIAVLASAAPAQAADEKKHDPKYKLTDTEHKNHSLDLRNKEHKDKLIKDLDDGKVEHLEIDTGMPNPMAWSWDLGIWAVVIFIALIFILRKMAWDPMLEGLQKREQTILGAVEEAKHARAETERVTAEFKAKMDAAYAEIPKLMDQARKDAQKLAEDLKSKAMADIAAERQRLRNEMETATDQALKQLQEHAASLATLISAKVLRREVSADDHRRLVDDAVADLVRIAKERRGSVQ
jgi:F-type H+-transporting ATPase subunit b